MPVFDYYLMIEKDGKLISKLKLRDPFDPVDMDYYVDRQTLFDGLKTVGWKPSNIDLYVRILDRHGYVRIRAEANKLPSIGPYKLYIFEEPHVPTAEELAKTKRETSKKKEVQFPRKRFPG